MKKFEATLKRPEGVGTWTYLDIPFSMLDAIGAKGQIKIKGTINGQPFSSSAMPHGNGKHYLVVKKEIRDAIGATKGDVVTVALEADTTPRAVSLPGDFKKILFKDPYARAAFGALAYSHQKEFVDWIESARRAETRERRIAKSLGMLLEGSTPKRSKT